MKSFRFKRTERIYKTPYTISNWKTYEQQLERPTRPAYASVGRQMKARTLAAQRAEARLGCRIISKMAKLGMSQSHRAA